MPHEHRDGIEYTLEEVIGGLSMTALWLGILVIACLASIGAGGWLLILAFRENIGWGLACLFIPFAALAFVLKYWEESKKPFLYSLASTTMAVIGVVGYSVSTVNADLAGYTDLGGSASTDSRPLSAVFDAVPIYSPDPIEDDDTKPVYDVEPEAPEVNFELPQVEDPQPAEAPAVEDAPSRRRERGVVVPVSELETLVGELVQLVLTSGQRMSVRVEAVDEQAAHVRHRVGGGSVAYTIELDQIAEVRSRKEP